MKVWAGCYVIGDDPENLPTIFIAGSEKELIKLLADDGAIDGGEDCETLDELSEKLSIQAEAEVDDISYQGITWETREL